MAREEAIAAAPYSRRAYWWMTVSDLAIHGFYVGTVLTVPRTRNRIFPVLVGLSATAGLLLSLQMLERLFFPVRAAVRSQRLQHPETILQIGKVAGWIIYSFTIAVMVMGLGKWFGFRTFEWTPLQLLMFAAMQFFRDLSGIKQHGKDEPERSPPLRDLKPLQSEECGTRGTSHTVL